RAHAHGPRCGGRRGARHGGRCRRLPHEALRHARARGARARIAGRSSAMTNGTTQTVYVVDDDSSTRQLLAWLMERNGVPVAVFPEARSFLERVRPDAAGCIVTDLNMPGMS